MRGLRGLVVFVLVLAVLKYFFGWPISIVGSVALTLALSMLLSRID